MTAVLHTTLFIVVLLSFAGFLGWMFSLIAKDITRRPDNDRSRDGA